MSALLNKPTIINIGDEFTIEEKINQTEILQYALENNIIDLSYVQEKIEMAKRKELLEKHPYKIWEGKDGYWHSYLFDETKAKNRRPIKKKRLEDLEDVIIDYYNRQQKENKDTYKDNLDLTLKDICVLILILSSD